MTLYIFDKDGTLVSGFDNRPANKPEEQILLPGVLKKITGLRHAGHKIAIASNQGGVAWGFITFNQAVELVLDAAEKIGGVSDWMISPYDPKAKEKHPGSFARDDFTRKPQPGMLIVIMGKLGCGCDRTIMIGDMESDQQAAQAANCQFIWAKDFFGWEG